MLVEMAEKKRSYGLLESFAQIGRWDDSKKTTLTTFGRKDRVEKWVVTDGQLYFVEPLSGNLWRCAPNPDKTKLSFGREEGTQGKPGWSVERQSSDSVGLRQSVSLGS